VRKLPIIYDVNSPAGYMLLHIWQSIINNLELVIKAITTTIVLTGCPKIRNTHKY